VNVQGIGCASVQRKKKLLQQEGVKFEGDKVSIKVAVLWQVLLSWDIACAAAAAADGAQPNNECNTMYTMPQLP
jgi:uncharacterized protein YfaQ (DUF2300 family)